MPRRRAAFVLASAALATSGCGGAGGGPQGPQILGARTYHVAGFAPAGPVVGRTTTVSFTIDRPDGKPLTDYRRGSGPHTGVHLIIVRDDLGAIVHRHPSMLPGGLFRQQLTLPSAGSYRVVIDAYPNLTGLGRNFQLFESIHVAGRQQPQALPPPQRSVAVGGYRFTLAALPRLKAIEAAFLTVRVTGPNGRPATFSSWYGALAHAIFFRAGSLDYFHTHVCSPGASGCTSFLGATRVAGSSSRPGKLTVGVLVPIAGTWRLFLQCKVNGQILTAPFTLKVR